LREKARIPKRNPKQEHEDHARARDALHAARVELQRLEDAGLRNREDSGDRRDPDEGSAGEEMFLGGNVEPLQAVRVPEFGEDIRRALDTFDPRVATAAVTLAGRLAAGDSHAWRGVRQLRMRPDVLRQKVGRRHRLFFQSNSTTLAIIDLIDRRDLEACLRRASGPALFRPRACDGLPNRPSRRTDMGSTARGHSLLGSLKKMVAGCRRIRLECPFRRCGAELQRILIPTKKIHVESKP